MSDLKLAGINSGFDTEAMIQQMMSSYQTKIDNQNKKLTMLTWQQEAYRDVISKLTSFQNKYFNLLNMSSYLLTPTNFSKLTTSIVNKHNPDSSYSGIKVITSSSSAVGSHTLKVSQTATASKLSGNAIAPENFNLDLDQAVKGSNYEEITEEITVPVLGEDGLPAQDDEGNEITKTETVVTGRKYNFAFDVKVGEISKTIEFSVEIGNDDIDEDGNVDMDVFADKITESLNEQLAEEFGKTGRTNADGTEELFLQVSRRGDTNYLDFTVGGNTAVTVTEKEGSFGLTRPAYHTLIDATSVVTDENSVAVTVNGITRKVTFEGVSEAYFDTRNNKGNEDVLEEFNQLKEASYRKKYNIDDDAEVSQKDLDNYTYTSSMAAKDKNTKSIEDALNDAFEGKDLTFSIDKNGFVSVVDEKGKGQRFTMTSVDGGTLGIAKNSASNRFGAANDLSDMGILTPDEEKTLTINGKEIKVTGSTSIDDLVKAVNESGAGVTMSYSKLENRFVITSDEMGSSGKIKIEGEIAAALGLDAEVEAGKNAILEIDGVEVVNSDNTYTLDDGTVLDVTDAVLDTEFSIGLEKDYSGIKQIIKDFVNDYNQLIDDVYGHIGTARSRDSKNRTYDPLTEDEKAEMTEKEIEKWEAEAKKGVIYNDPTISSIMSQIRTTLYSSITLDDGSKFGLFNMGITTVSYKESSHGKLEIDEEKLDAAFENNVEAIEKLFTDPQNSVLKKIDDILDRAVSTNTSTKGSLIRKAGLEGHTTDKDNTIYRQMQEINNRITTLQRRYDSKQEYWWNIFTRLESMMADFNSQSAYIANMFSTGSTQ